MRSDTHHPGQRCRVIPITSGLLTFPLWEDAIFVPLFLWIIGWKPPPGKEYTPIFRNFNKSEVDRFGEK